MEGKAVAAGWEIGLGPGEGPTEGEEYEEEGERVLASAGSERMRAGEEEGEEVMGMAVRG